ncbi:MAG: M55 family metallopeptidase [Mycobacteriales bacterium]
MRVFISVDMEGVAGIATLDQTVRGGSGYPRAQELMTAEANAAIRGAFAGGATEVVVNDSHGTMDNLLHGRLDRRARVVFGAPAPSCMVRGVEAGDAVARFIGYHAPASWPGTLAHTFSASFADLRVNGESSSEADVNALLCGARGVPVGVLTGDDEICRLAAKSLPDVRLVETKRSHGFSAVDSLHPAEAADLIEAAVCDAVRDAGSLPRPALPAQLRVEVDLITPFHADFVASVPGTQRTGPLTVALDLGDVDELMRAVTTFYFLATHAAGQLALIAQRR